MKLFKYILLSFLLAFGQAGFAQLPLLKTVNYMAADTNAVYPVAHNDTYVKATNQLSTSFEPEFSTDPALNLIDANSNNQWITGGGDVTNQRFHIDLGSSKTVRRVYYENSHSSGTNTDVGVKVFTLWGSNTASDFADLVYANDGSWVQLTTSVSQFNQHTASNVTDPEYFTVTNNAAFRYYSFKFATNWGDATWLGVRHIELQTTLTSTAKPILISSTGYMKADTNGVYPVAQSATYVKATDVFSANFVADNATDPALSLTGDWNLTSWIENQTSNMRFHIDLGSSKKARRVYYENVHATGINSSAGARAFTMWGSNTASDFADLVYANDGSWVQLTTSVSELDQHTASDVVDPKYFDVTNNVAYRYYAFKFATNWGNGTYMGLRHIEVQTTLTSTATPILISSTGYMKADTNAVYPVAHNTTYVKATTAQASRVADDATNPANSLTGSSFGLEWMSDPGTVRTNQRFHIDLGSAKTVRYIYYENAHESGTDTDTGVENFTMYGSNSASDFADLVYANNGTWAQLTTSQTTFDQHTASNIADPKYITVTNNAAYRYYGFKFADNWGDAARMRLRHIELQTTLTLIQ